MKIIYTILFFADTLALILLTFLLLKMIDNGSNSWTFALIITGEILSIIALILFLLWYLKIPPYKSKR
jgi:hypothetical protein